MQFMFSEQIGMYEISNTIRFKYIEELNRITLIFKSHEDGYGTFIRNPEAVKESYS